MTFASEYQKWLIYIKERFPLPVYLLLSAGFAMSGNLYASTSINGIKVFLVTSWVMLFFFVLRTMDEIKDFEKDKVANPTRPLPRGLFELRAFRKHMFILFAMLFPLAFAFPSFATVLLVITAIYLGLMYTEFFIGEKLEKAPLTYAISHQVILILLCMGCYASFSLTTLDISQITSYVGFKYGVSVLGAFFSYEICRKLDPSAHPILGTYLVRYGVNKTYALLLATTFVALIGNYLLYSTNPVGAMVSTAVALLLPVSFIAIIKDSQKFKLIEAIASISLIVHIWSGVFILLNGVI